MQNIRSFIAVLCAFFMFHVQASAPLGHLEKAYSHFRYALEVQWDQKDLNFHEDQMQKLFQTIYRLRKQGLSDQELMTFAKGKVRDQKLIEHYRSVFDSLNATQMPKEELFKLTLDLVRGGVSTDAPSWFSSETKNTIGVVLLVVAIVGLVALAIYLCAKDRDYCDEDRNRDDHNYQHSRRDYSYYHCHRDYCHEHY